MRTTTLATFALVTALGSSLIACDEAYDPDAPAIDPNAPRIKITSPARGTFAGDHDKLIVKGTAFDDQAVTSVTVNGVEAALLADGTFEVQVPVEPGTFLLHAVGKDAQGNTGKETRAVVVGPLEPIAQPVPQSVSAALTAQAFDAIGRGLTGFMTGPGLMSTVTPLNPVFNVGAPDGPDCLYASGSITGVSMAASSKITLAPQRGGIYLDAILDRPAVNMSLSYAAACIDGGRPITIGATKIRITGILKLGVSGDRFEVELDDQDVQITGFNVELGGIPGEVVNILHLDTAIGPILAFVAERFAVPYVNTALNGLNETKTINVLGTMVDVKLKPAHIESDIPGVIVELDTELRAHGDESSPGFVYVTNVVPTMDLSRAFELAVADDAANQLLGSFWAAKGMDVGLDLQNGSYGEVGKLYDRVEMSAKVPPFVDASGSELMLTVGDLLATFKNGPAITTQVAINATMKVKVVSGAGGALRLDVGSPEVFVDILDENVDGANQLSNAQFEAVSSFALGRIVALGSGAVGAVPLPSFGGVSVSDVEVAPREGYVVVGGEIQ
ncbi:MAG: hypothetical protein AB7T06_16545 [Kofleriaceae bacterium]